MDEETAAAMEAKQEELDTASAALTASKSLIRKLKAEGAKAEDINDAVAKMKEIQAQVDGIVASMKGSEPEFDRDGMEDVLVRRMIVVPSFEIHGGSAGFFDFGPVGCALKENILTEWKKHFILNEKMLQVECTCLTAEAVLQASGHVDRFTDLMVKDLSDGTCYRADKLLEDEIEKRLEENPTMAPEEKDRIEKIYRQADAYSPEELGQLLKEFEIKAPLSGEDLSEPYHFNLMFPSKVGPQAETTNAYLRPETAQGIFVNFARLYQYNASKLPFAAAQIGLGFRNEISPGKGLIRVREFQMAEIEHFVHPNEKDHPKFSQVADLVMNLFPSENQMTTGKLVKMTIGDAVKNKIVNNETLGYFMARTQLFLENIGIDLKRVRFRQHLPTEMAHYASDCWDAEIKTSHGWIECVGHADRSCYDLEVHSNATKTDLRASVQLKEAKEVPYAKIKANKKQMGKAFKRDSATVLAYLEDISVDACCEIGDKLAAGENVDITTCEKTFTLEPGMFTVERAIKKVNEEKFFPSVIEPSFGIGRILYSLLEHTFQIRSEEGEEGADKKVEKGKVARTLFTFNPLISPVKVSICSVRKGDQFDQLVENISQQLVSIGLPSTTDVSGVAIGRKYARFDEIGIPFGVTIDQQTAEDGSITVRERDSQSQVRLPSTEQALVVLQQLCTGLTSWSQVVEQHGLVDTTSS